MWMCECIWLCCTCVSVCVCDCVVHAWVCVCMCECVVHVWMCECVWVCCSCMNVWVCERESMCVFMCVQCTHVQVHLWGQSRMLEGHPQGCHHLILDSNWNWLSRLGWLAQGLIFPCLPGADELTLPYPGFHMDTGNQTQVLLIAQRALYSQGSSSPLLWEIWSFLQIIRKDFLQPLTSAHFIL